MVSRYIPNDLGPALRLKDLLQPTWSFLQPSEHPLGAGAAALKKYLVGREQLADAEWLALANLKRWAAVIDVCRVHWEPNRPLFVKDLLTKDKCRSLIFEIEVIIASVDRNVAGYEWPIYRAGERDIGTVGPQMLIECKLLDDFDLSKVLKRGSKAKHQARPMGVPFVVAVGFDRVLTLADVQEMRASVNRRSDWFVRRPEISALVLVMKRDEPSDGMMWNPLGFPGRVSYFGEVMEIRNHASNNPIPLSFSFGGTEGVARIRAAMAARS